MIAWLKGMVLYVAHGYKWSREIAEFVRWSQSYNLWCKMLYFGQQLERELREEVEIQRQSGPQNLLELLPDEFTREQYRQMRQSQGRSGDGESTLRSWQSRAHRWMLIGVAMATQENGTSSIDWYAMLRGWGMMDG